MEEAAATSESGLAHFPPGSPAPTAEQKLAERLAKMNEGKKAFYELPLEERQRIIADRKAKKAARQAEREAKRAAKENGGALPPTDAPPPTVRSRRSPTTAPPDSGIPRRGASEVRGLIDLCAAMPRLGDGTCFIQVTRLKPAAAFGIATAGVQKHIWDAIDDAEFSQAYGGAEYSLRGYTVRDDGKARALTEPITYKVAGAPNLDSALTEDDAMRPNPAPPVANGHPAFRRGGAVTPQAADAQARMHDRELTHEETQEERRDARLRRDRQETEERDAERRAGELNVARLLSEDKKAEMERMREMQERQLELVQNSNKGPDNSALLAQQSQQHSSEMRQLAESHKSELIRITAEHREELQRLTATHSAALQRVEDQARLDRARADDLVRAAEARAAEAIKETERRSGDLVRAADDRAHQRVTDAQNQAQGNYNELKTRSEERIADQNRQWAQRFEDLKDNHQRQLAQKDSEIGLMRSNLEGNMTVILAGKDTEIKRLQHDLRDAREQAEKNKDWVGKVTEFEKTAEKMGFQKGGDEQPEEDLKTTAVKAGLGLVQRLPELVQSAGDALAKVRNPIVPPDVARTQARGGMVRDSMRTIPRALQMPPPVQLAPLAFATEDGGYTPPPDQQPPRPLAPPMPGQPPPLPPLEQSPSVALAQQQQLLPLPELQPPPPPPAAAPAPVHTAPPPPPEPTLPAPAPAPTAPPPAAAPATAAPTATESEQLDAAVTQIVQQFTPMLAAEFERKVTPSQVAQQIVTDNGVELARMAIQMVTAEQLIGIIVKNPGQYSMLATRNGQKFLRDIWAAAEKMVTE